MIRSSRALTYLCFIEWKESLLIEFKKKICVIPVLAIGVDDRKSRVGIGPYITRLL